MGLLLEALSPENRDIIVQALNGPELEFPAGKIVTAFRSMHMVISSDTVIKHRRGQCRCFKIEEAVNG